MYSDAVKDRKWVYVFGNGSAEGSARMKNLLGGKGANLAEMSGIGIPVPPGFTITTDVCAYYYSNDGSYPQDLQNQVQSGIRHCEHIVNRVFGDGKEPLFFSVRSGAPVSMPGMMDTVLNLGMNDITVEGLAAMSGDSRFAYDSYRRFIQMYSNVVLGMEHSLFEDALDEIKRDKGCKNDTDLNVEDIKALINIYKKIGMKDGKQVPQDPYEQLWGGIGAVFKSWMTKRAVTYRKINRIPEELGTAVTVQAMVFGNSGDNSATGVCFSRDPSTGENIFYGEYLKNAQGEDVVAGIRTPQPITKAAKQRMSVDAPCMEEEFPSVYAELCGIRLKLEKHYRNMQDMEFTVENGKLWMLQTRTGKRTAAASVKIAVDMVAEGLITKEEAVLQVTPGSLDSLLHPMLDPKAPKKILTRGLPASPGAASGKVVFSADDAVMLSGKGDKVVLVRLETSPEDIDGIHSAEGVLTARGGMTSHAAVVARGMGKPCVSGAGALSINYAQKHFTVDDITVNEGDYITLDGSSGEVYAGVVPTVPPSVSGEFATLMKWADSFRRLKVRANAETPHDASMAVSFGAEGIGLARTEHMFFLPERIGFMREMILADNLASRRNALAKLLPFQRDDFTALFTIMAGYPVTVRLLDPPLHEFLPHGDRELEAIARNMGVSFEKLKTRATQLYEQNPMLGYRGCRLGVTYPEIYEMQSTAIFEAAVSASVNISKAVEPEIMIPLVATEKEFELMKAVVDSAAQKVMAEKGVSIPYTVGTMIELPRAAIVADKIAVGAEFFSFGTNDLTQTTLGISRDDAGSFIDDYISKGIYKRDPFASIDQEGVGFMIELAVEKGRKTRPDIKLGICGEHGGEPDSVMYCHKIGLTYVSCSPFRVPIARLAAAHAALIEKKK